jgi:hypothetical protein
MALPSWILVSVGGRRSQRPRPSSTLESLGPSHQRCHKSCVSLRGPPCTHGVSGAPREEACDTTRKPPWILSQFRTRHQICMSTNYMAHFVHWWTGRTDYLKLQLNQLSLRITEWSSTLEGKHLSVLRTMGNTPQGNKKKPKDHNT